MGTELSKRIKTNDLYMTALPVMHQYFTSAIDTARHYDEQISNARRILLEYDSKYYIAVPKIKNVIFSNPYTIVFWQDGTKTTVTCGEGDVWDEEKGIALAFVKKLYGNKGSYIDNIKPFLSENVDKEKAKSAREKAKQEAELKATEEKRKQRHIKNLAKKRIRQERLEKEIAETIESLKINTNANS